MFGQCQLEICLASRVERKSSPEIGEENPTGRENLFFSNVRFFNS